MIVLACGTFPIYERGVNTGRKEFCASHGYDYHTMKAVCVPSEHPAKLGAVLNKEMGEWVIYESKEEEQIYGEQG